MWSSKMALRWVLVLLMAAALGYAFQPSATGLKPREPDLPCPSEMLIKPCTCHANNLLFMTMNCSLINTNEDLERVFGVDFPFHNFLQLIIIHDPNDINNRLTHIKSDTFQTYTFERIIITGTKLQSIEENVFSYSHPTLTLLNLQNNRINDFPFETMALYTKLDTLLLDNNDLGTLEKFASESLKTLSVGFNPNLYFTYDVLEEIPNLINLNMESIGLRFIPQHMFANLTQVYTINFNGNKLTKLEEYTLDPLTRSVGRLMLGSNNINSSLPNSLGGLLKDAIVDLSNNKIFEMPEDLWKPFFEQVINGIVDLTGNDLRCGCDMSWMFLNTTAISPSDRYLPILTESTKCFDGAQVIFLDFHVFQKHCT